MNQLWMIIGILLIFDFPANNNNNISFKFKQQITGETGNGGTEDVEIMFP